tara:strand:- start:344 stop:886 length:543 start_codon:yes stop_codon:yes gene_type:complete
MLAQGPVEFPWNPDSDGDDFIGVNDLMALLGEFDSVFSEEALYLSEDSLSAMYNAGPQNFFECQMACRNLPGQWRMPAVSEVFVLNQGMWLNSTLGDMAPNGEPYFINNSGRISYTYSDHVEGCFCVTNERPKVEYSYCLSGSGIGECAEEKVAHGWIPQGGIHVTRDGIVSQAFWRWAE